MNKAIAIEKMKRARDKIHKGWTQGWYAKDIEGKETGAKCSNACSWCSVGAINSVTDSCQEAGDLIILFGEHSLATWNDGSTRTRQEVIDKFDEVISKLEKMNNDLIKNIEINIAPYVWDPDYVENIIGASMTLGVGTLSLSPHHLPVLEQFEDLPDIYINIGGLNSTTDSICVIHDAEHYLDRYTDLPQIKGINFPLIRERLIYGNINQTFIEDCEGMVACTTKSDKLARLRIDMQSLMSDTDLINICSESDLLGFAQLIIVSESPSIDVGLSVIKAKKNISTPTAIAGKFPSIADCEALLKMKNKSIIMSPDNLFKLFTPDSV